MIEVILMTNLFSIGAAIFWGSRYEAKCWNGGTCKESGEPWTLFDYDSLGGRGYTDGVGNYIWILYPWIDK
mgnify:CR=1 FL=1